MIEKRCSVALPPSAIIASAFYKIISINAKNIFYYTMGKEETVGIVVNAFSTPFIVPKDWFDIIGEIPTNIEEVRYSQCNKHRVFLINCVLRSLYNLKKYRLNISPLA